MNELREVGLGPFLTAVPGHPSLRRLLPDVDATAEATWAPPEPVTRLYLMHPSDGSPEHAKWHVVDPKARGGQALARFLRVSGSVETLYVGRHAIGNFGFGTQRGFKALADGVAASTSLIRLDLGQMDPLPIGNSEIEAATEQLMTPINHPELVAACKSNRIRLTTRANPRGLTCRAPRIT
tara:strand:- start:402 stop:944 length:543 start_codon:yes stop_codon:yes gene_type:complete